MPSAPDQFRRLVDIMSTLRSPDGCPWDRAQTIDTLEAFVLEETYEVLEAIDRHDHAALCEELAGHGLPATVQHDDLHDTNSFVEAYTSRVMASAQWITLL